MKPIANMKWWASFAKVPQESNGMNQRIASLIWCENFKRFLKGLTGLISKYIQYFGESF